MAARLPPGPGDVLSEISVDRTSPVPLYFQLARQMAGAIEAGRLDPGTRIENEVRLAEHLGLSRPTMRRAMQYLVDQGLVVRRRGVGTRVVSPQVRRSLELTSLYDDLRESGQRPATQVLANRIEPADPAVAAALAVPEGTDVVTIVRLRLASDQPIARLTNHLVASRLTITTESLEARGLYALLRSAGVQLHSATQAIGARTATAAEARLLGESRGAALLSMQRTAYDDHGVAVEYGSHLYAATRYSFQMSLLSA